MRIRETIGRRILQAIGSQFNNPYEAVRELVDNALDHCQLQHVEISIELGLTSLTIENFGGRGMGAEDLVEFVSWGAANHHEENDRGMFGQGGKAALAYLGRGFRLWCRRADTDDVFCLEDLDIFGHEDYADYGDATPLPISMIPAHLREIPKEKGFVRIESIGFNSSLSLTVAGLERDLAAVYTPTLRSERATIRVNGQAVQARHAALDRDVERASINVTIDEMIAVGWAGKLEKGANKLNPPRPGFSLYWRGRRIMEGVWFGANSYGKGSLAAFYGEIVLDGVRPNLNKSGLAETGEIRWEKLGDAVLEQAASVLDALRASSGGAIVTARDQRLARQVQEELQDILDATFESDTVTIVEERTVTVTRESTTTARVRTRSGTKGSVSNKPAKEGGESETSTVEVQMPRLPRIVVDSWGEPVRAETRTGEDGTIEIAVNKAHPAFSAATAKFAIAEGVVMECLRAGELSGIDEFIVQADEVLAAWASSSTNDEG